MATEPQIGNPYIEIANPARAYTVEYYYDDVKGAAPTGAPTSGTANVGDTVTISAGDNADATHFPKQTTVGTENYAFDEGVANVLNTTIVEDATKNVLKVHYAKDEKRRWNAGLQGKEVHDHVCRGHHRHCKRYAC